MKYEPTPYSPPPKLDKSFHDLLEVFDRNYTILLDFAKKASKQSCCNICNCLACDASKVLRDIGEDKRGIINDKNPV